MGTVGYQHPFYARADSGIVALGVQPGSSWSRVSGRGGVGRSGENLVGQSDWQRPFRWTAEGGYESAPPELRTYAFSEPFLSRDERVIAGTGLTPQSEISGYVWTDDGVTFLGDLPGGRDDSRANGMSADGSTVFGTGFVSDVRAEYFRWTASEGMVSLGIRAYGVGSEPTLAVSVEGDVFYGTLRDADERAVAFIWEEDRGARALTEVLAGYGLDLTDWELGGVTGLSDDGTTIVGWGINPDGDNEAWIAVVPEPSSGLLAALGALCATALRRRRADTHGRRR